MTKLNFHILTNLLAFCEIERTVTEMENRFAFDVNKREVHHIINFMMKQKLITQQPNFSCGGQTQPNRWLKNISLKCYAVKKGQENAVIPRL